jgi:hypothetical protein
VTRQFTNRCELAFVGRLRAGLTPRQAAAIARQQPTVCPHADCGEPRSCSTRCADIVYQQQRFRANRNAIESAAGAQEPNPE